jgi:hypothetical protein
MEIYRNELADVSLKVPVTSSTGTIDVEAYDGSTLLHTFSTVDAISGGYSVTLPFSLVDRDSEFVVRWKLNYNEDGVSKSYMHDTSVRVVTPYVTSEEITEAIPDISSYATPAEIVRVERRIRGVIENYTGQKFGRFVGKRQVIGAGDIQLKLPERLVNLTDISGSNVLFDSTGHAVPGAYSIRGDGYYLGVSNPTPEGDYVFENVIRDPDSMWNRGGFRDNVVYTVDGVWGYDEVPTNVKEAALILIEEALCPQAVYRERYLKAISGDGWRYEFVGAAYSGTGNVIADQLLEEYRRTAITVI